MAKKTNNDQRRGNVAKESKDRASFETVFGFKASDLTSWESFIRLMNRPTHPAGLAVFRVCYGALMFLDCIQERGLSNAMVRWGSHDECRFPLIHGLQPLAVQWMIVLQLFTILGALGIMLGFFFRHSCLLFAIPYWFIFILEKMRWNNHSYLFGLVSIMLLFSDANRYWSLDGLMWPEQRHTHIPLWNYFLPRFQIFILYFIAGLKKFDSDWTHGFSMNLADTIAFSPFKLIFSKETIDMYMVHTCGHVIDLTLGYLLFFDKTRKIGFFFGVAFNAMNSVIFSIGMFSYMCIASLPLFCYPDWPVKLFRKFPACLRWFTPLDEEPRPSEHCVYSKEAIEMAKHHTSKMTGTLSHDDATKKKYKPSLKSMKNKITPYHKWLTILTLCYVSEQLFLPYSHFITQGYNGWTQGLYGYSWDMMIHSWRVQFIKVQYLEKDTGNVGYLRPEAFAARKNRWSSNADMIKQYANCVEERLVHHNKTNVAIYIDVWKSMNKRFQQRVVDPRVNILEAEWHPLRKTPWLMPLLIDLSGWREVLAQIHKNTRNTTNDTDVVFVADFPGLHLNNFLQEDIAKANLTVLEGEVIVEIEYEDTSVNTTLKKNETIDLPPGYYHTVYTISPTPSCYYYMYEDRLSKERRDNKSTLLATLKRQQGIDDEARLNLTVLPNDGIMMKKLKTDMVNQRALQSKSYVSHVRDFFIRHIRTIGRAVNSVKYAARIIFGGEDPQAILDEIHNLSSAGVAGNATENDG